MKYHFHFHSFGCVHIDWRSSSANSIGYRGQSADNLLLFMCVRNKSYCSPMHMSSFCSVRGKKHPMINLPPGRNIVRGIPGHFSVDELSSACVWGNIVSLYRDHGIRLRHLIKNKKTSIPYYICQLNKAFAAPTQRMYFKIHFSKTYLFQHMHQKRHVLPITSGDGSTHVSARLIKGVDNRATITAGWKVFITHTYMMQGNIYAFAVKSATTGLCLTVYAL